VTAGVGRASTVAVGGTSVGGAAVGGGVMLGATAVVSTTVSVATGVLGDAAVGMIMVTAATTADGVSLVVVVVGWHATYATLRLRRPSLNV
jgi:hypothetical protein